MSAARSALMFALLPVFAGCQLMPSPSADNKVSTAGMIRMQGTLSGDGGKLFFAPCNEQRRYAVSDKGNTGILQEAASVVDKNGKAFADVRGNFVASKAQGSDGQADLYQLYRVERPSGACEDPNFKRLTIHASGNGPKWNLNASGKGLVLEREGKEPFAVPYMEEQMPEGRFNLITDANNQHVELYVAPLRCVDPSNGSVQHLTAELRVNGQVQRGCAYFGAMRND
ncbi:MULTISPECIES: COG3650 family protein [Pseudomonas]|jgi:putative lipoprotein|uniref:Membrane protein n=1 Tax=Pseudomonas lutea TaxID=243924 RepID=A0A9X0JL24_9PSED|nr:MULTISPECIES: membrane protein [Pseudomonas]KGF66388.1 membrane protein [Pseudomonas lutea]